MEDLINLKGHFQLGVLLNSCRNKANESECLNKISSRVESESHWFGIVK